MIHARIKQARGGPHNSFVHNPYDLDNVRTIIEKLRKQRGFSSDRALAIAAGIPQPTLSRFLAGTSQTMEVANFLALAKVLEVTMSELLGEVPISSRAEVRQLVQIIDALPEPQRKALIAAGEAMVEATKRH